MGCAAGRRHLQQQGLIETHKRTTLGIQCYVLGYALEKPAERVRRRIVIEVVYPELKKIRIPSG